MEELQEVVKGKTVMAGKEEESEKSGLVLMPTAA
jgi:hypothetical protein